MGFLKCMVLIEPSGREESGLHRTGWKGPGLFIQFILWGFLSLQSPQSPSSYKTHAEKMHYRELTG